MPAKKGLSKPPAIDSRIGQRHPNVRSNRMDWTLHQQRVRFDIRLEREQFAYLFNHPARALQDRLVRLGMGDRTKRPPVPEWRRVYLHAEQQRYLMHQARVLGWGKEKSYYYTHKLAA